MHSTRSNYVTGRWYCRWLDRGGQRRRKGLGRCRLFGLRPVPRGGVLMGTGGEGGGGILGGEC